MGQLDYESRLKTLALFSIGGRFLRADVIKLWKVMRGESVEELQELVTVAPDARARGHRFDLVPPCRTEL